MLKFCIHNLMSNPIADVWEWIRHDLVVGGGGGGVCFSNRWDLVAHPLAITIIYVQACSTNCSITENIM